MLSAKAMEIMELLNGVNIQADVRRSDWEGQDGKYTTALEENLIIHNTCTQLLPREVIELSYETLTN